MSFAMSAGLLGLTETISAVQRSAKLGIEVRNDPAIFARSSIHDLPHTQRTMEMKKLIGAIISIAMTMLLFSGIENLVEFGFYIKLVNNVCVWLLIFTVGVKDQMAVTLRRNAWIDLPLSILSAFALVYSGHTILATSVFISSAIIMIEAFRNKVSPA